MENIIINDAYEHNLKHLNLVIPLNQFTCVTGCSGCGKSSLVFDTIYAESQRAFLEGLSGSSYGQKLMNKPHVGSIENLYPAINISQNYYNVNPRSSISTVTEIAHYLRSLFAMLNSVTGKSVVTDEMFSSNNPKAFCPCCAGLGVETIISEKMLIPDPNVTLRNGGILYFKGPAESKEQMQLEALCAHFGINIDNKISELSAEERQYLLNADTDVKYKLEYREGKRKKKLNECVRGAIPLILRHKAGGVISNVAGSFSSYMEDVPCHECGGARLNKQVLSYHIGGLNYFEIESMEITALYDWLQKFKDDRLNNNNNKELATQLINSILVRLQAIILLDVGYLSLNRPIPSLSGGERQRIRIAKQLTCSLKGIIYILDEPCRGLHYRDVSKIINASRDLIKRGNTVIAIEHNNQYIAAADMVIQLGPEGGPKGGYLLAPPDKPNTIAKKRHLFKVPLKNLDYFAVEHINFRNIHEQSAHFPVGGITCITGVSGSGKSTLASVVADCFMHKMNNPKGQVLGCELIQRVIQVNQAPIGKTPRSTVVSYLGIFDDIRALFAKTAEAKKLKLNAASFSMNVKGERCECCQGTGLQKIEFNFLPSTYITCPECGGKRFKERVLSVSYCGKSIHDVLETPISELTGLFKEDRKISSALNSMIELGLGYLKLGQMSMNLSGGEAQRIKLARALSAPLSGRNLYILDEPTSGLNAVDIERFSNVLFQLQKHHETLIIIEHNIEFIAKVADYIIDFGTVGGANGGTIVAQGAPEEVFSNQRSSLYGL